MPTAEAIAAEEQRLDVELDDIAAILWDQHYMAGGGSS